MLCNITLGRSLSKKSVTPVDHNGLYSGDLIPADTWTNLVDARYEKVDFNILRKGVDVIVLYADPRRMSDGCKAVTDQFRKLPLSTLKMQAVVVSCDDSNDIRKYLKKTNSPIPTFGDPTKAVRTHLFYFLTHPLYLFQSIQLGTRINHLLAL